MSSSDRSKYSSCISTLRTHSNKDISRRAIEITDTIKDQFNVALSRESNTQEKSGGGLASTKTTSTIASTSGVTASKSIRPDFLGEELGGSKGASKEKGASGTDTADKGGSSAADARKQMTREKEVELYRLTAEVRESYTCGDVDDFDGGTSFHPIERERSR